MLERHVHYIITAYLKDTRPLSDLQWGGMQGRSTVTSLLSVVHEWLKILESGKEVYAVFFDLKKVFDTVPHRKPVLKLQTLGLSPLILEWTRSYLTDRKQCVLVGGETSSDVPVLSGVPQGSVLGPLLFLLYIDDVSPLQLSSRSTLNLYADDMLLFKPVSSDKDSEDLQSDINYIQEWAEANYLTFNTNKCKTMLVSRKWDSRNVSL